MSKMSQDSRRELEAILDRICDQSATVEDRQRLNELLTGEPALREQYVALMRLQAELVWRFMPGKPLSIQELQRMSLADSVMDRMEDQEARRRACKLESVESGGSDDKTASLPAVPQPTGKSPSRVLGLLSDRARQGRGFAFNHLALFSVVAATVLLAVLLTVTLRKGQDGRQNPNAKPEIADDQSENLNPKSAIPVPNSPLTPGGGRAVMAVPVARLTRSAEACWGGAARSPEAGSAFAVGQRIILSSGAIELVFDVGVRAVVQAPADMDLVARGKVFLRAGKVSVEIMKPEARGFEVGTSKGSVVDLGTEFAVDVSPSQDVQVHVFKGEVVVQQPAGPAKPSAGQHVLASEGLRMETDRPTPWLVKDSGETFIRTIDDAKRDRHVVAYWRFEDRPLGVELPSTMENTKQVRATVDSSYNGNDLYTWCAGEQPVFSSAVPAGVIPQTGKQNKSCLDNSRSTDPGNVRNVYTHSEFSHAAPLDVQKITPAQWTIEASVNPAKLSEHVQTFVGRDCYNLGSYATRRAPPRLAFQINAKRHFAVTFFDVEKRRYEAIAAEPVVKAGRWYHLAAVSDGQTLRLYVDSLDGHGYLLRASTELSSQGSTALGKGDDDAEWSIGRGRITYAKGGIKIGEAFQGLIDEVRISDAALNVRQLLFAPTEK